MSKAESGSNGLKRYLIGAAVALTTALLIQSGALIWWAASLTTRVNYVEHTLERVSERVYVLEVSEK